MKEYELIYGEGWHPEEHDGFFPFRWMKKEARCLLRNISSPGKKYLRVTIGHPFGRSEFPFLEIFVDGEKIGERTLEGIFSSYIFSFETKGSDIELSFKLKEIFPIANDTRELGVMFREIEVLSPPEKESLYGFGWYEWEYDDFVPFRWMSRESQVILPQDKIDSSQLLSFWIFSEFADFSQKLTISLGKRILGQLSLIHKWNRYHFLLHPPSAREDSLLPDDDGELRLFLNKPFPLKYHPDDPRELGIRVGPFEFHNDLRRYENFLFFHQNAQLNYQEMHEGKTELQSYPLNLGIDLYGQCNIKPPCVYCLWERMKDLEGEHADMVVDEKTLKSYGPFFRAAGTLVNCSFGEPLLHPRFKEILDFCAENDKILEISTNGQTFTERTIKALLGKPIYLYVSLDAARKETYAKIRNENWDRIIPALIRLNKERKKARNWPKIYMVFMPIRVNKDDLEDYFRLCQKIEADALVLRPLLYLWEPKIEADRGGYHFDYEKERLSREEIEEIFRKCAEFSKKYHIPVANQFTFGLVPNHGER